MPEDWTDRKMGGPGEGNFFNEVIPPGQDFELDLELIDELEVEVVVED